MEGKLILQQNSFMFYAFLISYVIRYSVASTGLREYIYIIAFLTSEDFGSTSKLHGEGPPSKKSKSQRSRNYRRKVKCTDCGAEMNADNFLKHNTNKHNGRAKSQNVKEASQTTLNFAKVFFLLFLLTFESGLCTQLFSSCISRLLSCNQAIKFVNGMCKVFDM